MANITLMGASYTNVPAVNLPKTGGGLVLFTDTQDATAADEDIISGKTAYVDGDKITGTLEVQEYYTGSSDPGSFGNNGDLYLKVVV